MRVSSAAGPLSFLCFSCLGRAPGSTTPPDSTTDLIPSHTPFAVVRRLGQSQLLKSSCQKPTHSTFVNGDWQARAGVNQLGILMKNTNSCRLRGGGCKNTTFCRLTMPLPIPVSVCQLTTPNILAGGRTSTWVLCGLPNEHKYSMLQ